MKKNQVPQDNSNTYGGHRKLLYATDNDGNYSSVQSSGWEVEELATHNAITELKRLRNDAWQRAKQGLTSPLEYHMYDQRMDIALLSQTTNLFQWRIKRHFKPAIFSRLNNKMLHRYCESLGIDIDTIKNLPDTI